MKRRKPKKPIPVFYYRVEHPSLKLVPITVEEFEGILMGLGYEQEHASTYYLQQQRQIRN